VYFHFGTRKVIEAAGVLLKAGCHQRMSYFRMLKLLYLADRVSLQETGRPIIGTRPVAMKHGALHSEVLDLVKGRHRDTAEWAAFIRTEGYEVELCADPGVGSLSRYEIGVLGRVSKRYRRMGDWDLAEAMHKLPEWAGNYREKTSTAIPFADIIEAVGRSQDCEAILRDAKETRALQRLLGLTATSQRVLPASSRRASPGSTPLPA